MHTRVCTRMYRSVYTHPPTPMAPRCHSGEAGSLGSGRLALCLCVSGPPDLSVEWPCWGHACLSHNALLATPAQDTLTEISEWLQSHPREVVILACRNFEGMTEDLHEYLVGCIKNIFGDMLCPRGVSRRRGLPMLSAAGVVGVPGFTAITDHPLAA